MRRAWVIPLLAVVLGGAARAEMREIATRHYRVHTDLEAAFADELGERLDAMFDEYARRLADFRPATALPLLDVYLYQRRADYARFAGQELPNSGGVFMPGRNALAAFLDGQGRDGLRRTLQHEAFHQFAHSVVSPNLPVWLNEGLAQLFEEGIWTGQRFWLGQVPPRRVRQLHDDMNNRRLIEFRTFMNLSLKHWTDTMARDPAAGAAQYNQAWAMVHFLVNARDEAGQDKYRARLIGLLKLIHSGKDPTAAFAEAFSGNIEGFQGLFVEFARGLKPTPEATYVEHQEVLADMLREFRRRRQTFDELKVFREVAIEAGCRMQYVRGPLRWTTEADPTVYFSDLSGRLFDGQRLFFQSRRQAPLPDVVSRCTEQLQLRTRFHAADGQVEHETLVEVRR